MKRELTRKRGNLPARRGHDAAAWIAAIRRFPLAKMGFRIQIGTR
jgi:hypothetical protein